MCQSKAYLKQGDQDELILEDVEVVRPEGDKLLLMNIFGERRIVDAQIKMIDLVHHKILLEKS